MTDPTPTRLLARNLDPLVADLALRVYEDRGSTLMEPTDPRTIESATRLSAVIAAARALSAAHRAYCDALLRRAGAEEIDHLAARQLSAVVAVDDALAAAEVTP